MRCVKYLSLYWRTYFSHFGWLIDLLFMLLMRYLLPPLSIYGLTKSRIQSLIPMVFSLLAFVFGMINILATSWTLQCVFSILNSRITIDII